MATNPVYFRSFGKTFQEKKTYGYVAPLKRLIDNVTGSLAPGLSLPISGVKSRFNLTARKFVLNFTGEVGLDGLGSSLPTLPPALGGGTLSSLYLSGRILLKGKAIVDRKKPLVAKDFKAKLLAGELGVRANGKSGSLLLGLEDVKVPFTSQVLLNRQLIADPVATSRLIATGSIQATPTGALAPLVSGLLSGSGGLMLPVV